MLPLSSQATTTTCMPAIAARRRVGAVRRLRDQRDVARAVAAIAVLRRITSRPANSPCAPEFGCSDTPGKPVISPSGALELARTAAGSRRPGPTARTGGCAPTRATTSAASRPPRSASSCTSRAGSSTCRGRCPCARGRGCSASAAISEWCVLNTGCVRNGEVRTSAARQLQLGRRRPSTSSPARRLPRSDDRTDVAEHQRRSRRGPRASVVSSSAIPTCVPSVAEVEPRGFGRLPDPRRPPRRGRRRSAACRSRRRCAA